VGKVLSFKLRIDKVKRTKL